MNSLNQVQRRKQQLRHHVRWLFKAFPGLKVLDIILFLAQTELIGG